MEARCFWAFGLVIETHIDFSNDLPVSSRCADVVILESSQPIVANLHSTKLFRRGIQAKIAGGGNKITLYWEGAGIFRAENGVQITYNNLGADDGTLKLFLLSEVMGLILFQRNHLLLHGSAVQNRKAGATIFLGAAGAGKSTTAAALAARGHTVLTDDLVAIAFDNGTPVIVPAFSQLKLWLSSIKGLGLDPLKMEPSYEGSNKFLTRPLSENFPESQQPISQIWCIGDFENDNMPLSQADAYLELLKHFALPDSLLADSAHFTQIVQVVKAVPIAGKPRHLKFSELEAWIEQESIGC